MNRRAKQVLGVALLTAHNVGWLLGFAFVCAAAGEVVMGVGMLLALRHDKP